MVLVFKFSNTGEVMKILKSSIIIRKIMVKIIGILWFGSRFGFESTSATSLM